MAINIACLFVTRTYYCEAGQATEHLTIHIYVSENKETESTVKTS